MTMPDSVKLSTLMPYISGADILLTGQDDRVAGIRYDELNMFTPIIILMEQGLSLSGLKEAASRYGIPVHKNDNLVKNLFTYGKPGDVIPDSCCREVAAIMARMCKTEGKPESQKNPSAGGEIQKLRKPQRLIRMELGITLMDFLERPSLLEEGLGRIRKRLSRLFGYPFPPVGIRANNRLKGSDYRIIFKSVEAGRGSIDLGWYRTVDLGLNSGQIRSAAKSVAAALVAHIEELVLKRAQDLLGRDEVQAILDRAEKKYPVVTGEVKCMLSLGSIRDILRGLVSEQVSIRHIQMILETLADWATFGPAPNEVIIEQIRQSLKQQICMEYADDRQTLRVLTLDANLEQKFSDRVMYEHGFSHAVSPEEWLEAFSPGIRGMEENGLKPVVLCNPASRSWIKEFTRMRFPNLAVLSYVEIPSDIRVESVGEIALKALNDFNPGNQRTSS